MKTLLMSLVCLLVIAGCHTTKHAPALVLVNDIWVLESLNGYPLEKDSFDAEKPRLEIKTKDKMYFGYSGCNNINGKLDITETAIAFKPGPMTRKACLQQNIEPDFLTMLNASKTYKIKNGKLILFDANGKTIGEFRKVD
jgi:heat shock protein HslJ